jgi:Domain of unknown function (DUF4180)
MMEYIDHGRGIVELHAEGIAIEAPGDILDIVAESEAETMIVRKENLNQEFFRLGSGFAGEMLQKISNYRKRLAIIGDYSKLQSKPLRDFIYESNKNGQVLFVASAEEALEMLRYVSAQAADAAVGVAPRLQFHDSPCVPQQGRATRHEWG